MHFSTEPELLNATESSSYKEETDDMTNSTENITYPVKLKTKVFITDFQARKKVAQALRGSLHETQIPNLNDQNEVFLYENFPRKRFRETIVDKV